MGAVLNMTVRLISDTCITCGIEFAMPEGRHNWLVDHKGVLFFCPNGHAQSFSGETEAQKLQRALDAKKRELDAANHQLENVRELNEKHLTNLVKANKKLERARNGICPCCKRSFSALRRHMATKHPDFKP